MNTITRRLLFVALLIALAVPMAACSQHHAVKPRLVHPSVKPTRPVPFPNIPTNFTTKFQRNLGSIVNLGGQL